jgi:hypothetical protein
MNFVLLREKKNIFLISSVIFNSKRKIIWKQQQQHMLLKWNTIQQEYGGMGTSTDTHE